MDSREISLYLPSNTECSFHENKTSDFITVLNKPIELEDNAEIALLEIIYPNRFHNIHHPINVLKFYKPYSDIHYSNLSDGYYRTANDIMSALNNCVPPGFKTKFSYDEITDKTRIVIGKDEELEIHEKLSAMLGFFGKTVFVMTEGVNTIHKRDVETVELDLTIIENKPIDETLETVDLDNESVEFYSKQSLNLRLSTFALYIYSSIVESTIVGNSLVPLLGIINTNPSEKAPEVHLSIEKVNFIKLNTNRLQNIDIQVRDSQGDLIKFRTGNIILRLLIRRQNGRKH